MKNISTNFLFTLLMTLTIASYVNAETVAPSSVEQLALSSEADTDGNNGFLYPEYNLIPSDIVDTGILFVHTPGVVDFFDGDLKCMFRSKPATHASICSTNSPFLRQ